MLSSAWSTSTSRRGAGARDLAAQLRADRPARAGDHHDLRPRGSARRGRAPSGSARGRARPRRRTSRTWRAKLTDPGSSSNTVGSVRTRMPRSRHARTTSIRSAPGRRRDRDDDLVGLGLVEDLRQLARRAAHAHAVDAQPPLERVVVDEADRVQAELRVARELLADLAPALAGADDQHVALGVAGAQARQPAVVDRAREHARRGEEAPATSRK